MYWRKVTLVAPNSPPRRFIWSKLAGKESGRSSCGCPGAPIKHHSGRNTFEWIMTSPRPTSMIGRPNFCTSTPINTSSSPDTCSGWVIHTLIDLLDIFQERVSSFPQYSLLCRLLSLGWASPLRRSFGWISSTFPTGDIVRHLGWVSVLSCE